MRGSRGGQGGWCGGTGFPRSWEATCGWTTERRAGGCRAPGSPGRAGEAGLLAPWGGLEEPQELLGPWRGPIPHSPELSPSPGPSSSSSDSPTGGHKDSGPIAGWQEWGGLLGQCSHRARPNPVPEAPPPVSLARARAEPPGAARGTVLGGRRGFCILITERGPGPRGEFGPGMSRIGDCGELRRKGV